MKEKENKASVPYSFVVGSLMYAIVCTRPNIAHAVGVVSRFMVNPGKDHWEVVKWIFRYLRGSFKYYLSFGSSKQFWRVIHMQIWLVTLIVENLLLGVYLLL